MVGHLSHRYKINESRDTEICFIHHKMMLVTSSDLATAIYLINVVGSNQHLLPSFYQLKVPLNGCLIYFFPNAYIF